MSELNTSGKVLLAIYQERCSNLGVCGAQFLDTLRKRSDEAALLRAYCELFRELAVAKHASWHDYVADEVWHYPSLPNGAATALCREPEI